MRRSLAVQLIVALALASAVAAFVPPRDKDQKATYLGSFTWDMAKPWFGGFSGLSLSGDGSKLTALSDRGFLLTARIDREGDRISAVRAHRAYHIKSSTGDHLSDGIADSEGLAIAPDGTIFISFEGVARVARYDSYSSPAVVLQRPKAFRTQKRNKSFEPLAIDDRGRLYTLPEKGLNQEGKIPVFRWENGNWSQPFSLFARGSFLPVGADFGPDGRFYLLERAVGVGGFRARIRRWDMTETEALNEVTLLETGAGTHDNLEGLSVWRDAGGRLRATMVADDNFKFFQNTELVEYALPE